jgi:homoserine kinase
MDDRLHQPYRAHLVPGMEEALAAARAAGALAAALSGSGPTLIAFTAGGEEAVAAALKGALAHAGVTAQTRVLGIRSEGACVA